MANEEVKLLDTKRVEEFITQMERFTIELNLSLEKIQTSTKILGVSFRDAHYDELKKNIHMISQNLQNFIDDQKRLTPGLRQRLEDILLYQKMGGE